MSEISNFFGLLSSDRIRNERNTIKAIVNLMNKYALSFSISVCLMAIKHILS